MKLITFLILFLSFLIYTGFVYTSGTEVTEIKPTAGAIEGKLIFQKFNCTSCHQFYGLGGFLGPDLTNVMSQGNREPYIRAVLKSGTQRMPNFKLNDEEINQLVEYLKYTDKTSKTNN